MDFISNLYMPIVLVACLCVGYVFKKWIPADDKWIPTVMLILGAVLGCVATQSITLEAIVSGGVSGLASTGMYELFAQLINQGGKVATVLTDDEVESFDSVLFDEEENDNEKE